MSETHPEPIAERSATEDERTDTKSEAGYADDVPVQAPVCLWTTIDQPASSTLWGGQSAANGHLETLNCGATTDDGSGMGSARLDTRFVPNATLAAPALPPPPPDPAILAQQAYPEL